MNDTNEPTALTSVPMENLLAKPNKVRKHRRFTGRVAVAIYAGLICGVIGSAGASPSTTPTASETPTQADRSNLGPVGQALRPTATATVKVPGPTVTVTSKPVVTTKVETRTVTKAVVPAACAQAMKAGDKVVDGLQFIVDWNTRYLTAVSELDTAKMSDLNDELNAATASGRFNGIVPNYQALEAACSR